jgi:hypothetical protein
MGDDMDVLCVGMYRACSTWQYDVMAHLLERHRDGQRLGYLTGEDYAALGDPEGTASCWRILKSHEGHRRFADVLATGRARAVYAHRDLRDVVFSLMHKRGVGFDDVVRRGMLHQILVNDHFWLRQPGVLVQRYEDLIAQPAAAVAQLADHLGIVLAAGEAEETAREYSFQANRARVLHLRARLRASRVELEPPANSQLCDRRTLLHWNHLREGRVGDWRIVATPRQHAILARIGNRWLRARGYETGPAPSARRALGAAFLDETAIAQGRLACALRCLALRFPDTARIVKRVLQIAPEPSAVILPSRRFGAAGSAAFPDAPRWAGVPATETIGA